MQTRPRSCTNLAMRRRCVLVTLLHDRRRPLHHMNPCSRCPAVLHVQSQLNSSNCPCALDCGGVSCPPLPPASPSPHPPLPDPPGGPPQPPLSPPGETCVLQSAVGYDACDARCNHADSYRKCLETTGCADNTTSQVRSACEDTQVCFCLTCLVHRPVLKSHFALGCTEGSVHL